jgi:hypothetical protein
VIVNEKLAMILGLVAEGWWVNHRQLVGWAGGLRGIVRGSDHLGLCCRHYHYYHIGMYVKTPLMHI